MKQREIRRGRRDMSARSRVKLKRGDDARDVFRSLPILTHVFMTAAVIVHSVPVHVLYCTVLCSIVLRTLRGALEYPNF